MPIILGPDTPAKPLGFTCCVYSGTCISPKDAPGERIITEDGIKENDEVLIPGLTHGYYLMTIRKDPFGVLTAQDDYLLCSLEFDKDDRHAWVVSAYINLRSVERLELKA